MAGQSSQFSPNTVLDSLFSFEGGMDAGENPILIQKNEMGFASGLTIRGTFAHPRPPRMRYTLDFGGSAALQTAVTTGLFQGYCYFQPDTGIATMMASISGRLYQFTPNPQTRVATVADVTGGNPQNALVTQCWLWQAENYVIWNDGVTPPGGVFFNGNTLTTARSAGNVPPVLPTFTTNAQFVIPATYNINSVPPPAPIAISLTGNFTGANGDTIGINLGSTFPITGSVVAGAGTPNITVNLNIVSINPPTAIPIAAGAIVTDTQNSAFVPQFPVGRMGAYGRGRIWMSLADGKRYMAGDIVGGPSGTKANNFRDAILNITENNYLVGGGTFTVPGSVGDIRAMIFEAELDTSLGQGPLLIITPTHVFSCNAPIDRLQWQTLINPIQTETAIGNGGLGQDSTFLVNSDVFMRAVDGIRSLKLSREDFQRWNRVPISREINPILARDNQSLLPFSAGVFFNSRALMTVSPFSTTNGVYHQGLAVINTDEVSKITQKGEPVYDGIWPGMNLLGLKAGYFNLVERCYQFVYNTVQQKLEFWELLPDPDIQNDPLAIVGDNNTDAIQWWLEGPSLQFRETIETRTFKRLINGEILVDNLVGRVEFQVFYKPDQYACWVPWHAWTECAVKNSGAPGNNIKPQFRPRMGLGTPSDRPCDESTKRPLREGYTFQIKIVVTGQCEIVGMRVAAVVIPEPTFAPPACNVIC